MNLGFVPLHPKGIRPGVGKKNPYKSRPRAYASGQAGRRPLLVGCSYQLSWSQSTPRRKHWCLNTENNLYNLLSLFLFLFLEICEIVQKPETGKGVGSPTLLQNRLLFFSPLLCSVPGGADAKPSWAQTKRQSRERKLLRRGGNLQLLLCWAWEATWGKRNGRRGRRLFAQNGRVAINNYWLSTFLAILAHLS